MNRRRPRLGSTAALLALLMGATGSGAQTAPIVVPAKFDAQGFVQFLIPVTVNGERFWRSLDSGGSWVFSMDTERARRAGLQPNSSGSFAGAGPEVRRDQRVTGVTAAIGPLQLPNLTIVMVPLPTVAPDMECIFGLGILQDYIAQFDYSRPELRLFSRDAFQPSPRAVAVPFEIDRFRNPFLTTTVRLQGDDTATARLMLDTGASYYSVVFAESFARTHGIRDRLRRVVPQASHTPGLKLSAARVDALRIGPFEPRLTIAALLDTPSAGLIHDGMIGAGFFRNFVVTFDYGRRQMWLEPLATIPDRQTFDASGLDFTHAPGGRYRVHDVLPESPAAGADVRAGDLLVSIDDQQARELTIRELKDRLSRGGATVRLTLERNGAEHRVALTLKELL